MTKILEAVEWHDYICLKKNQSGYNLENGLEGMKGGRAEKSQEVPEAVQSK